jgi:hypothetical protein
MTSAARQKIDRQTMQLFDPEVERPDHDQIVTRLFGDDEAIRELLTQYHGLKQLPPFAESDQFALMDRTGYGPFSVRRHVPYADAVQKTGTVPKLLSQWPVRLRRKKMEVLLDYFASDASRTGRLMGFIDLGVDYVIARRPFLVSNDRGGMDWHRDEDEGTGLFEVKGQWPTQGALVRQLNLYAASQPRGFHGRAAHFVVGPDDSVNAVACAHGYRLVTFDAESRRFTLQPSPLAPKKKRADDEF